MISLYSFLNSSPSSSSLSPYLSFSFSRSYPISFSSPPSSSSSISSSTSSLTSSSSSFTTSSYPSPSPSSSSSRTSLQQVGKPAAVFLDEPSSGMDPQARRSMWKIILDTTSNRCTSVVLTTHSMEECEALCSRVGMMCAGRLVCLGSPQDLKSRFGDGYHLELHVKGGGQVEKVKAFVEEAFKGAVLEEEHLGRLRFNLPLEGSSLSRVFGTIEKIQTPLHIDDYSISQCSLEQVFLTFAQSQAKQSHEVVQ